MIERTGRVIAIHAHTIDVQVSTPQACSQCGSSKRCHGDQHKVLSLPLSAGIATGDEVALGIEDHLLHASAIIAYLLPALSLMLGAWAGENLTAGSAGALIGGGIGLACGIGLIPVLSRVLGLQELTPALRACPTSSISTHSESSQS